MFDDEALGGKPPSKTTEPPNGDELSAELSKAAREAVRQPPDPRLEAQFARLLGEDAPATPVPPRESGDGVAAAERNAAAGPDAAAERDLAAERELAALSEAVRSLEARHADVERRLALVTRILGPVLVALVVLAVAVAVRSVG